MAHLVAGAIPQDEAAPRISNAGVRMSDKCHSGSRGRSKVEPDHATWQIVRPSLSRQTEDARKIAWRVSDLATHGSRVQSR